MLFYDQILQKGGFVSYTEQTRASDEGRLFFQKIAFKMIQDRPLIGIGYKNYVKAMPRYSRRPLAQDKLFPVHNIYLLVLAETGLLGLIALIDFLITVLWRCRRVLQDLAGATVAAVLLAILLIGNCDHFLLTVTSGKWLFFALPALLRLSVSDIAAKKDDRALLHKTGFAAPTPS